MLKNQATASNISNYVSRKQKNSNAYNVES